MMLRAETDLEATTEVSSSNLLTFTLPDEIEDGTPTFVLLAATTTRYSAPRR